MSGIADDPAAFVALLEQVAARVGAEVRYEALDPSATRSGRGGGVCRIRGATVILVDANLATAERAAVLVESLARFDLEAVYLPPAVRARIRAVARKTGLEPRPLARTRGPRDDDE